MSETLERENIQVHASSGNVFADLGFEEPEEEYAKATLALRISRIIRQRRWSQARAAQTMGIDQPKVSKLVRGQLLDFSTERLLHFLTCLDQDVEIVVKPKATTESKAQLRVSILDNAPAAT
jgi:predicted XRE-type DNA-binding protein